MLVEITHTSAPLMLTSSQGIHVLLNNCPKLTHLSLTGVQAFLRDELLTFCRDAPPEFNDHQRDVFCVFSGNGVSRLRDFLNQQKAHAAVAAAAAGQSGERGEGGESSSDFGSEGDSPGNGPNINFGGPLGPPGGGGGTGGGTPVLNMNVAGTHAAGNTPVIPTPTPGANATQGAVWLQQHGFAPQQSLTAQFQQAHFGGANSAGTANLSQSAPASTTPWLQHHHAHHQQQQGQQGQQGGAQHVTGLMGAAVLDEVDEGDEAFGEGSEIMEG